MRIEIEKLKGPIVVFGAGGFIGANIFRQLLGAREDVYGIIHQSYVPWRLIGLDPAKILRADITQPEEVKDLFRQHKFQNIFYLAAFGAYSRQNDPKQIFETNVMGLLTVLQEASRHGFAAFVHAGTSSEYGENSEAPLETDPLDPNSFYAVSKVSASFLIRYMAAKHSLPVVNLRLYSVYGPWEEPDRLMPRLIEAGLAGRYPPFVDPDVSHDFIYVDDVVESFVLAATRGVQQAPGQSLNIATGVQTTLREVASHAKDIFGLSGDPEWRSMPNRSWDLKNWYGNPAYAEKILSWRPKIAFREGLDRMVEWQKQHSTSSPAPRLPLIDSTRLSAVIACYKDSQAIPVMHERLTKVFRDLKVDYEIIFVNDGSPDDTREVLQKLCDTDDHVIAVEHSRNFGSQNAFLSGMDITTGDAVILLDGDLQDPPELIRDFFQRWRDGYEVIYGRRVKRQANFVMNLCFKLFYRLFNWSAYIPIPVDAGDFSMMDRRVVIELLKFPETDQFLRGLRAWVGFRQTNVDYVRPERAFGVSTNNWIKNIWWARKGIFSFSFLPLDLMFYGGIVMTLISLTALLVQVVYRLLYPTIPHGITTIIVLILFFGGIQIMCLSVLGEYLGKTLEEVKHRPKFIRHSVRRGKRLFQNPTEIQRFITGRRSTSL
jgi:dolichol-phosphate mannosyltransferase